MAALIGGLEESVLAKQRGIAAAVGIAQVQDFATVMLVFGRVVFFVFPVVVPVVPGIWRVVVLRLAGVEALDMGQAQRQGEVVAEAVGQHQRVDPQGIGAVQLGVFQAVIAEAALVDVFAAPARAPAPDRQGECGFGIDRAADTAAQAQRGVVGGGWKAGQNGEAGGPAAPSVQPNTGHGVLLGYRINSCRVESDGMQPATLGNRPSLVDAANCRTAFPIRYARAREDGGRLRAAATVG